MSPLNRYKTLFCAKKQTPPTAQPKKIDNYSEASINWEKVYSLHFRTTLDSKLREFQYKILNNIVFTNILIINYFTLAFFKPLIVLFAMRNQNPLNIYSPVAKCRLNFGKKSCPGGKKITSL